MRDDARRYQIETATRARSDAQQLILRTRLATQRETVELLRQASEEIKKVLADIRMIRIMAQEELAAQRKFTDAAKLRSMYCYPGSAEKSEPKKKRRLPGSIRPSSGRLSSFSSNRRLVSAFFSSRILLYPKYPFGRCCIWC